jgi:hypothetical protein
MGSRCGNRGCRCDCDQRHSLGPCGDIQRMQEISGVPRVCGLLQKLPDIVIGLQVFGNIKCFHVLALKVGQ